MKYNSQAKWQIHDIFSTPLETSLDSSNRWYQLANALPWDKIEKIYNRTLRNAHHGAGNKPARLIVGALIVKHDLNLSDAGTIEQIRENPYLQYFVGLKDFSNMSIFDSSLFVSIRKRMGVEAINEITLLLMESLAKKESGELQRKGVYEKTGVKDASENETDEPVNSMNIPPDSTDRESFTDDDGNFHSGSLIIDATCCESEVKYPTDLDVLNDAVEVSARVAKRLGVKTGSPVPRTCEESARGRFLEIIKKKRKSKSLIRKGINQQLYYLRRHINIIVETVARNSSSCIGLLKQKDQQFIGTCLKVYYQQKEMYDKKIHKCADRIISVFQPHIRPIVRGKSKAKVEFGPKTGVSIVRGFTFIDRYSYDAYNESEDLKVQVDNYVQRFGYLPVKCYADRICLNRANRKLLGDFHIQAAGKPLGRPAKEIQTAAYKQQSIQDKGVRNAVEATFGTAKRVYRADDIRAKLPDTADTWTAMCFLAKNIRKFLKELLFALLPKLAFPRYFLRDLSKYFCDFLFRPSYFHTMGLKWSFCGLE